MKPRDVIELLILAAIWGASFLFTRISVPTWGPWAVAGLRVALAAIALVPLALMTRRLGDLQGKWKVLLLIGLISSALPFYLYSLAAQSIQVGLSSILNATTPLWAAAIARIWLGDRLSGSRVAGLFLGLGGVAWLAADQVGLAEGADASRAMIAIAACLLATFCYGLSANVTQKYFQGVHPMVMAAGSQTVSALLLMPGTASHWPADQHHDLGSWASILTLGLVCTAMAFAMYFRLITRIGSAKATSVTFLIPMFAVLWGALFLGERINLVMALSCGVILLGTALATGLLTLGRRPST
jgi:drug/metabolite transporter (DMT)-like permease